jgi:hypothetical protein
VDVSLHFWSYPERYEVTGDKQGDRVAFKRTMIDAHVASPTSFMADVKAYYTAIGCWTAAFKVNGVTCRNVAVGVKARSV